MATIAIRPADVLEARRWAAGRISKPLALCRHLWRGYRQLRQGAAVGERKTPVLSFWDMREKWAKRGWYWEQVQQDGDIEVREGLRIPGTLQLAYWRIPGTKAVLQIAYLISRPKTGGPWRDF